MVRHNSCQWLIFNRNVYRSTSWRNQIPTSTIKVTLQCVRARKPEWGHSHEGLWPRSIQTARDGSLSLSPYLWIAFNLAFREIASFLSQGHEQTTTDSSWPGSVSTASSGYMFSIALVPFVNGYYVKMLRYEVCPFISTILCGRNCRSYIRELRWCDLQNTREKFRVHIEAYSNFTA